MKCCLSLRISVTSVLLVLLKRPAGPAEIRSQQDISAGPAGQPAGHLSGHLLQLNTKYLSMNVRTAKSKHVPKYIFLVFFL